MSLFVDWLVFRNVEVLLRLLEHAEFFDPQSYNAVFEAELEKLIARIHNPELRQQVSALRGFDFSGYLAGSLRKAGFRDDEAQEGFHSIVIKLLVSPGKLFSGWNPKKHGPLERRFRRSVWNGIRNLAEKSRNRRKWIQSADPTMMADRFAARRAYSGLLDDFRKLVSERLGNLALAILDAKLSGEDAKSLVGNAELGNPSIYNIKREMGALKKLGQKFAVQTGNITFINLLDQAMESEMATVEKRKQSMAAKSA